MDPNEPMHVALATAQNAYVVEAHRMQAWMTLYQRTGQAYCLDRMNAGEAMCAAIWEHIVDLMEQQAPTPYALALTAEEMEAAELAWMRPIIDSPRGIDFAAIKERVDIVDHISKFTQLRKSGARFVGKCPLPAHADKSPSFWVYPETKSWYCFGCNHGGDVIAFAQLYDGTQARVLADQIP